MLRQYLARISLTLDCYDGILRSSRILFIWFLRKISRTFRIPIYWIVTSVSWAHFSCIGLLRWHLVQLLDSPSSDFYVRSRALLGLPYIESLRCYLAHFLDYLTFDCYVKISCTFRILFHRIVRSVSRTPRIIWHSIFLLVYSLSTDCQLDNSRSIRIAWHLIFALASRAILGLSYIRLLR